MISAKQSSDFEFQIMSAMPDSEQILQRREA
jgi:hypothetical protein